MKRFDTIQRGHPLYYDRPPPRNFFGSVDRKKKAWYRNRKDIEQCVTDLLKIQKKTILMLPS